MSSEIYTFLLGLMLGVFVTASVISQYMTSEREECEINLLRSEHCVLVWVKQPEEVK